MATMLPPYLADDVKSRAEIRIFQLLRDDPDTKNWVVLHSLGLSRHAYKRYGELDFVVLLPGGAVVCLEVKGGRISCTDGVWETINRFNEKSRLSHSPFAQAQEGMFALRKIIAENAPDGARLSGVCYGYGVLFPDVNWEQSGPDYEAWQVYDRAFIGPISLFIKNIAARNADSAKGFPRPTTEDVAKLRQFLRPDFEARINPVGQMQQNEDELLRLTEEQYDVLDNLEGNPRLVVEGAAGTGKTLLALEAARRAAARGERVLLMCFNRLLGRWIEHRVASFPHADRIVAGSYHQVLERAVIAPSSQSAVFLSARSAAMGNNRAGQFFHDDYPLYALDAISEGAVEPFDLILVDEGQDLMNDGPLMVFDNLLKSGWAGGHWMFFADFNRQAIFAGDKTAEQMRAELQQRAHFASFTLKRNCRNTRRVGRETALLSGFERLPFSLHARNGDSVDYRFYDSDKKQRKVIGDIVGKLLDEGLLPADIVLLSPVRREGSCLTEPLEELERRGLTITGLDDTTLLQPPPKSILFSTLHAFKGLERRAVIVIGVERLKDDGFRAGLYVAMSRPTSRLFVLLSESVRSEYNDLVHLRNQWQTEGHA